MQFNIDVYLHGVSQHNPVVHLFSYRTNVVPRIGEEIYGKTADYRTTHKVKRVQHFPSVQDSFDIYVKETTP